MPSASSIGDGPHVGRRFSKSRVITYESVLNMSPFMDRPCFCPGYSPPHCLTGRYYFSTQRASGGMNCQSQLFSIPWRYTVRFGNAIATAQYLSSTCSTRDSTGTPREVQCQFDRRRPCEGQFMTAENLGGPVQVPSSTALCRWQWCSTYSR